VQRVAGVATRAPFGDVGLADDDGACALEHRDNRFILGRDVVGEQHTAKTRRQSLGVDQVLDAERKPVQRPERIAAHHGSLAFPRRCARRFERARNDRVDGGIDLLDPPDATVHQFDRRKLTLADQCPGRHRGQIARLAHVRITLP
jgi:hypothetical protein